MVAGTKGDRRARARVAAVARVLGASAGEVLRAEPSLAEGGGADVGVFSGFCGGIAYATLGLVGSKQPADGGGRQVELVLCTREPAAWAPALLSALGRQSLTRPFGAGEVIDLPSLPGSKLAGLLFAAPDLPANELELDSARGRLLLVIGISASEVTSCRKLGAELVAQALKDHGVFPFTDLGRRGVAHPQRMRRLLPSEVKSLTPEDDLDRRAALLVEGLLAEGGIEPVNQRARASLARKLADLLQGLPDDPGPRALAKAAAATLDLLVEAPEVAEVFADEAQVALLLKTLWTPGC